MPRPSTVGVRTVRPSWLTLLVGVAALFAVLASATAAAATTGAPAAGVATVAVADLDIATSGSPSSVAVGQVVTFSAEVTNAGPATALDVVLDVAFEAVPARVQSSSTTAGSCVPTTPGMTCRLGALAPASMVRVVIKAKLTTDGRSRAVFTAHSPVTDPDSRPARAQVDTRVGGGPGSGSTYADQIVTGYFTALLGRKPSTAELISLARPFVFDPDTTALAYRLIATNTYRLRSIDAAHLRFLGRLPSATARSAYLAYLNAGRTSDQLWASLLGSGEYYRRVGATPARWVDAVVKAVTGRPPSASTRAALLRRLAAGSSRAALAYGVVVSGDARVKLIDDIYRRWLERAPTAVSVFFGALALLGGETPERYLAAVLGDFEYYSRFVLELTGPGPTPTR